MNNLIKWLKLQLFILEMLRKTNATIEWFYQLVQSIKYVEPKPILLNFLNRRLFGKQNQIEIVRMAVLLLEIKLFQVKRVQPQVEKEEEPVK